MYTPFVRTPCGERRPIFAPLSLRLPPALPLAPLLHPPTQHCTPSTLYPRACCRRSHDFWIHTVSRPPRPTPHPVHAYLARLPEPRPGKRACATPMRAPQRRLCSLSFSDCPPTAALYVPLCLVRLLHTSKQTSRAQGARTPVTRHHLPPSTLRRNAKMPPHPLPPQPSRSALLCWPPSRAPSAPGPLNLSHLRALLCRGLPLPGRL